MKVTFNENKELVAKVQEGLKRTGGYCPCRLERTPDTKCMCKEFRDQIADPKYEGYCHCLRYYKHKYTATRAPAQITVPGRIV